MSKQDYDNITILLKQHEIYLKILRGLKDFSIHYFASTNNEYDDYISYRLEFDDEIYFIQYFETKINQIEKSLKELGYYE